MKRTRRFISTALVSSLVLGMTMLTGCTTNSYIKPENAKNTLAVTIGEDKINMDKLIPTIFLNEVTYDCQNEYYNVMYSQYGMSFGNIWEQEGEDGLTGAESIRKETMDNYIITYILNKAAKEEGSKTADISEDDIKKLTDNAEALIKAMSDKMLEKTGLTAEAFVEYQKMVHVANAFSEEKKESFGVKAADVEADVDFDNVYRQYNSNYVRISLTTTDDEGNSVSIGDDAKAEAKKTMDSALADLKAGKNIDDICATYEGVDAATSTYTYTQADAFPLNVPVEEEETEESEETTEESEEEEEATDTTDEYMLKTRELANGEYSEVFEYNGYYYIALMEDNNSKEAYDAQIETEITNLEVEKLDEYIEDLKLQAAYEPTINEEVWNTLEFGELTIEHDEVAKFYGTL